MSSPTPLLFLTLFLLLLFLCYFPLNTNSQISSPITNNQQLQRKHHKKRKKTLHDTSKSAAAAVDISGTSSSSGSCKSFQSQKITNSFDLLWETNTESSIYQTPTIYDFFHDGKKELIVPTFVRFLDVIQSENGASAPGWPYSSQQLASHSSALLYDIDTDGQMELVVATLDGKILFYKQNATLLAKETLQILPLPVRKFWYRNGGEERSRRGREDLQEEDDEAFEAAFLKKQRQNKRKLLSVTENAPKKEEFIMGPGRMPGVAQGPQRHGFKSGAGEGWFSPEARQSMDDFFTPSSLKPFLEEQDENSRNPFQAPNYQKQFEQLKQQYQQYETTADPYIYVDPHILGTPVIVDLDQDGHDELIVASSYYFDREYYSNPDNMKKLDTDINLDKYVAGAITVIDLHTGNTKWTSHLDLSTDKTKMRAYIYGSPTVIDLDSDGNLEVVVGTSLGFIYVLDKFGKPKPGFPISVGEVQGQVLAEDINLDGDIELCACDFDSILSCFDHKGNELWSIELEGNSAQVPVVGDINGDGALELVLSTDKGYIYAVNAGTGDVLKHFPVRTGAAIYAPALLTDLSPRPPKKSRINSLDVIVPSFDGFLYIVNGKSGCSHKIDIGEKSFSQVLVDDFVGNGRMQLVVSTMNGNVFVLGTQAFYHPLKAQTEEYHSTNGFSFRYRYHGIHVTKGSRRTRDVIGDSFKIAFKITDQRRLPRNALRHYHVRVSVGRDEILREFDYSRPGAYLVVIPAPKTRMHATVTVQMMNEHGQVFRDQFAISFNMNFLRIIKWLVVGPFVALLSGLYLLQGYYKKKEQLLG